MTAGAAWAGDAGEEQDALKVGLQKQSNRLERRGSEVVLNWSLVVVTCAQAADSH